LDRRVQNTRLYSNQSTLYTSDFSRFTDYSIKRDVKRAWGRINIDYLQPNKCLEKKIYIEVNNDNDSRFSAKDSGFLENHLNQVFTSVYNTRKWTY
jgi:hypothetical protein